MQTTRPSYMPKYKPDSSCVLYLEGQQDPQSSTIRDLSGYNNHGTITGATWVREKSGVWVNSFDGNDDYIDCGNNAVFDITTYITLMAWIKNDGILGIDQWVISKATQTDQSYTLGIQDTTGVITFIHHGVAERNGQTAITPGIWQHIATTLDGTNCKIYLNGNIDNTIADVAAMSVSGGNLSIGSRSLPSSGFFFDGTIGKPLVSNRALTVTEISGVWSNERHLFGV